MSGAFRVAARFDPRAPTMKSTAGGWRVTACWPAQPDVPAKDVQIITSDGERELVVTAVRPVQRGRMCNPAKLLRESFAERRAAAVQQPKEI